MLFNDNDAKATYLQIRVKQKEKEALKQIAKKHNMTLTEFIKNACNEYAKILEK